MPAQDMQPPQNGIDGLSDHVRLAVSELGGAVERCAMIESLLGGLAGKLSHEELANAQRMDELTQIVRGVHHYLSLAQSSASNGRRLGRDRILDEIRPRDLAQRLAGDDPDSASEPQGDVELF